MSINLALVAVTIAPWVAFLFSAIGGGAGLGGHAVARTAAAIAGLGFVATVVTTPFVLAGSGVSTGIGATSVRLDALAMILCLLVQGLSTLIQSFAIRYLRGDVRQVWFVTTANLLTAFTVLVACAGSVAVFTIAWVGAGIALVLLLATYRHLGQAQQGVRRTGLRFLIADTGMLVGVALLMIAAGGDVRLDDLGTVTASMPLPVQLIIAALVTGAALARSSQIPFTGWLPFTLAAPTPVSALMHAGVVNAGAILLIRFSPVIAAHQVVMIAIFLAGAATLVFASAVRLVRADVKGRLVFSTMAQMGFMIMACGLGLFAAAIFHLVAHSLFKSSLFLGAGSGVREHAIERDLPSRQRYSRLTFAAAVVVAVLVPAAALFAAKSVFSPTLTAASLGLLAFVSLTATVALAGALTTKFSVATVAIGIGATCGVAFGYVAFLHIFGATLNLPVALSAAPAWLLILPAIMLLAVQFVARNPPRLSWLSDLLYTRSLVTAVARPPLNKGISA